jgi:lipopolysaccharide transport system permease protein
MTCDVEERRRERCGRESAYTAARMASQNLFLLREFIRRDFKGRYAGSMLGFLWSFLQPLWNLLLFTFIFSVVLKISPIGERTDNFAIFLFCGLLPWTALQEGVMRASTAITDNSSLVKKVSFPSELLVLSVVGAALLHEAIAGGLFLVVLAAVGEFAWRGLPLLLLAIPIQVALTAGLGLLLASINVFFRDTAQVLGMVFMGWFYLTPIVYPAALLPERFRPWIDLNPAATLVALYRQALLGGGLVPPDGTFRLAVISLVLLAAGMVLFRRLRVAFADEI